MVWCVFGCLIDILNNEIIYVIMVKFIYIKKNKMLGFGNLFLIFLILFKKWLMIDFFCWCFDVINYFFFC